MKTIVLFSAAVSVAVCGALSSSGCSSTSGTGASTTTSSSTHTGGHTTTSSNTTTATTTTTTASTSTSTTTTNPAPPTIGMQIDRMGRPAINTALNHAFDPNTTTAGSAKDTYNQNSDPTTWATDFGAQIAGNLAILDSLDGVCGNQLLATPAVADAGADGGVPQTRYATLAGALAGDKLWLNTAGTTCTTYLAVEANATSILANTDCGGRGLAYNVIDVTYSALAVGAFTGVTNGVTMNDVAFLTTFPYEAAPH